MSENTKESSSTKRGRKRKIIRTYRCRVAFALNVAVVQHGTPDQVEDQAGAERQKGHEEPAGEQDIGPEEPKSCEDDFSEPSGADHRGKSGAGDDFHEAGADSCEDHGKRLWNADVPELLAFGHSDSGGAFEHEIRDAGKSYDGVQKNRWNGEDSESGHRRAYTGSHDRDQEKKKRKGSHDTENLKGSGDDLLSFC